MENKLEFDNKSVKIIFNSGAESFYYDSKEEALKAIKDCYEKKKITKAEFRLFVEEITSSDLPSIIEGLAALAAGIIGIFIETLIEESAENEDRFKVINPSFALCDCGKKPIHGYFYGDNDESISMEISSKQEALIFIDMLEKKEIITEGDASSLRVVVDMVDGLVESPLLN